MRIGIWKLTDEGIFGTGFFEKYYIERKLLSLLINGKYIDMLVQISQKTDLNHEHIADLNNVYLYAIGYFKVEGITDEILKNTYAKQKEQ